VSVTTPLIEPAGASSASISSVVVPATTDTAVDVARSSESSKYSPT
jgi:hypothetical protein